MRKRVLAVLSVAAIAVVVAALAALLLPHADAPTGPASASAEAPRPPGLGDPAGTGSPVEPLGATGNAPLWSEVDEADVDALPHYAPEWATEGRVLVRVTEAANAAGGWRVGDQIALPLPQLGVVYRTLIEELDVGPGPSISALGKVEDDDGHRRRWVVTVGPAHAFAYIDTPRGPYELMGDIDYGWLLPSSSMMAGFDFSEPDYILPEPWGTPDAR